MVNNINVLDATGTSKVMAAVDITGAGGALSSNVMSHPAPPGAAGTPSTAVTNSVSSGGAAAANVTLAAQASKTNYVTGFQVTGGGATAASIITVTLTGLISGTATYFIAVPAGVTLGITPLVVTFPTPMPASGTNVALVLNVPSFGTGNTASASSIQGFYM